MVIKSAVVWAARFLSRRVKSDVTNSELTVGEIVKHVTLPGCAWHQVYSCGLTWAASAKQVAPGFVVVFRSSTSTRKQIFQKFGDVLLDLGWDAVRYPIHTACSLARALF